MAEQYLPQEQDFRNSHPDDYPSPYLKMEEGDNIIRVASKCVEHYDHWVMVPSTKQPGTSYRRRIVCPGEEICPICIMVGGDTEDRRRRTKRWTFKAVDRTPNSPSNGVVKLLTVPWSIFKVLKKYDELIEQQRMQPFKRFDIIITKSEGRTTSYSTVAEQPTPLPKDVLERIKSSINKVDHRKEAVPNTPEEIKMILQGQDPRTGQMEKTNDWEEQVGGQLGPEGGEGPVPADADTSFDPSDFGDGQPAAQAPAQAPAQARPQAPAQARPQAPAAQPPAAGVSDKEEDPFGDLEDAFGDNPAGGGGGGR